MGIICSICHKKQSGFQEDFSLSREHMEMRICANCHEHLRIIEKTDKRSVARPSIAYFNRLLALDMCPEARETIKLALSKYEGQPMEDQAETNTYTYMPLSSERIRNASYNKNYSGYANSSGSFLDNLYADIGQKIKNWAKWIFIIELIAVVIGAFAMLFSGDDDFILPGILTLILGPIVAFVSTWILYGFGELIDKTCANEQHTRDILRFLYENNKK